MTLALRLAAKGRGFTSPNPMVGAVVVNRGAIVGQGFHRKAGGPHAEVIALSQAGSRAKGGTLYVTLEPCSHLKKRTPPCVPLIVKSEVRRVVVAMIDPNPQVRGRGLAQLRRAGMRVDVGCAETAAHELNDPDLSPGPEIVEALVIGQEWDNDTRIVLFVRLRDGLVLDDALEKRIKAQIRSNTTPRHVPSRILQVGDIPRTKRGKIVILGNLCRCISIRCGSPKNTPAGRSG